jgi:hypothetical protein
VGTWNGVSGNRFWFGDEMKNLGPKEPWRMVQLESARTAAAALLAHLGHSDASMLCGHKEYAQPLGRKTDPHTLNMTDQRRYVAALIGDDMAVLTEAEQFELRKFLTNLTSVDSNVGFVTQCVEDIREKNAAGGYASKGHTHNGGTLTEDDVRAIVNGSQIVAPT